MFKTLAALLLGIEMLFASTYSFTEIRYSDALGASTQLHGEISFEKEALRIDYSKDRRSLDYRDGDLTYMEDEKPVKISEQQVQGIVQYFEILLLLHSGDESALYDSFEVEKAEDMTILRPIGTIGRFVKRMELIKDQEQLRSLELSLKNGDTITISIDDEIR